MSLNPMLLNLISRNMINRFPRNIIEVLKANLLHAYFVMLGGDGCAASKRSNRHSIAYGFDTVGIWLWERV